MSHEQPPDPRIGAVLDGRYEILRLIGIGGSARVYAARHVAMGREVAVKILGGGSSPDPRITDIVEREARFIGKLDHPNIVAAMDVGVLPDGAVYIVLELLRGVSLADELARHKRLPVRRAVHIARQVAAAMVVAHKQGIIHRDLKPEHIFLEPAADGEDLCKVVDFGVAKELRHANHRARTLTGGGGIVGTLAYMAPEQLSAPETVDQRVDGYALGAVLFEMLTGRRVHEDTSYHSLLGHVLTGSHPRLLSLLPKAPVELAAIVDKALEGAPGDRYQSMEELAQALREFVQSYPGDGAVQGRSDIDRLSPSALDVATPTEAAPRPPTPATDAAPRAIVRRTLLPNSPGSLASPIPNPVAQTPAAITAIVRAAEEQSSNARTAEASSAPGDAERQRSRTWAFALASVGLVAGVLLVAWSRLSPRPQAAREVELTVASSAPGALVTFRGVTHPAPFKLRIAAQVAPETVEVRAAGRKTRTYELRLDRDVLVDAELAPEVEAKAPPSAAPAPVPSPGPALAVDTTRGPPEPPRAAGDPPRTPAEPGRAAVGQLRAGGVAAPTRRAAPLAPSPLAPSTGAPVAVAAPAVPVGAVAAGAPVAALAPPASRPVTPVAPASALTAPPPPASPRPPTSAAAPARPAALASAQVAQVVAAHRAAVDNCIAEDPGVGGALVVRVIVGPTGAVKQVRGVGGHGSAVERCLLRVIPTWPFPAPVAAAEGEATFTVELE